jgi:hypothetical protein
MQTTQRIDTRRHQPRHIAFHAEIRVQGDRPATKGTYRLDDFLGIALRTAKMHRYVPAARCETERQPAADALCRAGDQHHAGFRR